MGKDFEVMIIDSERKKNFIEIFGTNIVKIESPIPKKIIRPNGEEALAYFLDLNLITDEERERLINNIVKRFDQSIEFVREHLDEMGVPILKEGCSLWIENPQRWFG